METLVDLSASTLEKSDDVVSGCAEKVSVNIFRDSTVLLIIDFDVFFCASTLCYFKLYF